VPKEATRVDIVAVLSRLAMEPVGDETDERILRTASAMLLGEGLADFEVDVVAARCGVGRSTLYRRFGDRNTLIAAALAHEGRRFFTALADAVAAQDDIVDQVVDAFCAGLRLARAGGLADLLRTDPLLLRALTVDGGVIVAAARSQLVALAGGRHPDVDAADVERNAEILVRLGISFVLTPESVLDLDGDGCERSVRQIVAPLLGRP
jgi:AcrR family transcriptional regulator